MHLQLSGVETLLITMLIFTAGTWLGGYLRDRNWADKADGPTRMEYGGRLYRVLHEERGITHADLRDLLVICQREVSKGPVWEFLQKLRGQEVG